MPPHDPPPSIGIDESGDDERPPKGTPGERGWFGGRIKDIERDGPKFGPRKNEYLPYLLVRANPGDRGARPLNGVFWESPDVFVAPETDAAAAPLMPATTAGVAKVGAPTTLYAHVWNLGRAPAWGAFVEFSWFNPSLGFNYANANRIGVAMVDLGDRFTSLPEWREARGPAGDHYLTRGCHAIVRCPTTWVPTWENGGHECLVVRVFEPLMDPVALTSYDALRDRHVGQRNIAVVPAASPAALDLVLDVGPTEIPGRAEVEMGADPPSAMPWLALYVGRNRPPLRQAAGAVTAGLLPPTIAGARRFGLMGLPDDAVRPLLNHRERFAIGCDPVQIGFHASANVDRGEAHVLRIRQHVEGALVGGYTVVLVKR